MLKEKLYFISIPICNLAKIDFENMQVYLMIIMQFEGVKKQYISHRIVIIFCYEDYFCIL